MINLLLLPVKLANNANDGDDDDDDEHRDEDLSDCLVVRQDVRITPATLSWI